MKISEKMELKYYLDLHREQKTYPDEKDTLFELIKFPNKLDFKDRVLDKIKEKQKKQHILNMQKLKEDGFYTENLNNFSILKTFWT